VQEFFILALPESERIEAEKGLQAAENQRRAAAFNSGSSGRLSKTITLPIPEKDRACHGPYNLVENNLHGQDNYIKIWAAVGLAAIRANLSGAWRAWQICKHLDQGGGGKVTRADLWTYLDDLGIGERKRRRWIGQAKKAGLLRFDPVLSDYYMVGQAQAAIRLGCKHVGRSAAVRVGEFVKAGWRANVWSAYLTTLNGRLVSQEKKAELTGVPIRTQNYYQMQLSGSARRNYAQTELTSDHITGLRDHGRSSAFVGKDNRVYYRLPDMRTVPDHIARTLPKGRSKKIQKQVNLSCYEAREQGGVFRLFHEKAKGVKSALNKIRRSDHPPWELPDEVFLLTFPGKNSNIWQPAQVGDVQAI